MRTTLCDRCGGQYEARSNRARYCLPCRPEVERERDRLRYGGPRRVGKIAASRTTTLRSKYGITEEQYDAMLAAQGGRCAICRKFPPANRRLAVDHNHKTGQVRGLLCTGCNYHLLGRFRDDAEKLRRAAEYVTNPPAVAVLGDHRAPTPTRRHK